MTITAGTGHSAIEKREATERMIRQFEAAPCIEITAKGVALCCKTPGNLKSDFREGDIIHYKCCACGRGHWRAFAEPGDLSVYGNMVNARRTYELSADTGAGQTQGVAIK